MRRLFMVGAGFVGLVALFTVWRTPREVAEVMPAEGTTPAPLSARIVDSTARPPAPPERARAATTPGMAAREPSDTNEARFRALHQAVVTTTPEAARLYSDFAKAGVATPAQARTLVQLKERGTSHDDMVAYVRTSFPNDVIAQAVALRWLDAGSVVRPPLDTNAPRAVGGLVKRDAN